MPQGFISLYHAPKTCDQKFEIADDNFQTFKPLRTGYLLRKHKNICIFSILKWHKYTTPKEQNNAKDVSLYLVSSTNVFSW